MPTSALTLVLVFLVAPTTAAFAAPPLPPGARATPPAQLAGGGGDPDGQATSADSRAAGSGAPTRPSLPPVAGGVGEEVTHPGPVMTSGAVKPQKLVDSTTGQRTHVGYVEGESSEDTAARTPYSTVFHNPDGTSTKRIWDSVEFLPNPGVGGFQRVEPTLVRQSGDGRFVPAAAAKLSIAPTASDPSLATLALGGGASVAFGLADAVGVSGRAEGAVATFAGVRPGADLEFSATASGLKEEIVLHSASAPTQWVFPLRVAGARPVWDEDSGSVYFVDRRDRVRGVIPPGFMVDSKIDPRRGTGARSNNVRYTLVRQGSGWALRVDLDATWLRDPARVFPVRVDPSTFDTEFDDTYVSSRDYAGRNNSGETDLLIGTYDSGGEKSVSFMHFNSAIGDLTNKYILGANLWLYNYWSYSCTPREVWLHALTEPWYGPDTRWWPGPSFEPWALAERSFYHGYYNCPSGGWENFTIPADRYTSWTHGAPFYGFTLRASLTDSVGWKRFWSGNGPATARPHIDVDYRDEGAAYGLVGDTFSPSVSATTAGGITARVTNLGSSTWTPTNNFRLTYAVLNSSGTVVHNGPLYSMPYNVGPGGVADVPIQVGPVAGAGDFTLRLDMVNPSGASFNAAYSVPFGTKGFSIANGPPTVTATSPAQDARVTSLRPVLWSNYVDFDNSSTTWQYEYQICNGTPAAPVGCQGSGTVTSSTWPVPAGVLTWNTTSYWRVRVSDTALWSAWSAPIYLTPMPTQPAVSSHLANASDGGDLPNVNPQFGNWTRAFTDAQVSVVGPPLEITRTYNSQDSRTTGGFGAGWTSWLDQRLVVDADGSNNVVVTLANGSQVRFGYNPAPLNTYAAPPGLNLVLVQTTSPTTQWTLRDSSGSRRVFDANGLLVSVTDVSGRSQTYAYTAAKLTTVTDTSSGRHLNLTWTGAHVTSVSTDPPSVGQQAPTWTYSYSGDRLTSVCSPLGATACTSYTAVSSSYYRSSVLDDDPVGYWPLGEGAGASTAKNLAARRAGDNDGLYTSVTLGVTPGAVAGSTDKAATFSAAAPGHVALPRDLLNVTNDLAVELWFKAASGSSGVLFSQASVPVPATPWGGWVPNLYIGTDGKLRGEFWSSAVGGAPITTSGTVTNGQWHHVVLSAAFDAQYLYLDGALVGSITGAPIIHDDPAFPVMEYAHIGNGFSYQWPAGGTAASGYFPFTGSIDEVALYHHRLSSDQVTRHWNARTAQNRIASVVEPGSFVAAQIGYHGATGRVSTLTDRNGAHWTLSEPELTVDKRTVSVSSDISHLVTYTYDPSRNGRLVKRQDGSGANTWEYNAAGYVSASIDPNGNRTDFTTDARGNVIRRTTQRTAGVNQTEYFGYFLNAGDPMDPRNDVLIWQSDARSASATDTTYRTTYTLDAVGRVTQTVYPKPAGQTVSPSESFAYSNGTGSSAPYTQSTQSRSFIAANTTVLPLVGDEGRTAVSLPFPVWFHGHTYNRAWVDIDGYLSFNHPDASYWDSTALPAVTGPNNAIYAFWDDIEIDGSSSVRTTTVGTAPNRQFVVEWRNVFLQSDVRLSAEAVISENGEISLNWSSLDNNRERGSQATVGIENAPGTGALMFSHDQASLVAGTAVVYTPNPSYVATWPAYTVNGQSRSFTPANDTVLDLHADDDYQEIENVPFPIPYFGQTYDEAWISTNGFVSLTNPGGSYPDEDATAVPSAGGPNATVYPFWDDLIVDESSSMRTATLGTMPNRRFVVEWRNVRLFDFDESERLSIEVIFNESGEVEFNYSGVDSGIGERGEGAIIGLEDAAGVVGAEYAYYETVVATDFAVVMTPTIVGSSSGLPPAGQLISKVDRAGGITSYSYNTAGDLTSTQDPAGLVTAYGYDQLGRMTTAHRYSAVGAPADYGTETYTYNGLSQRTATVTTGVPNLVTGATHTATTASTYDLAGRLTAVTTADTTGGDTARTTAYTYDPGGRLVSTTAPDGAVTTQQWDTAGDPVQLVQPGGPTLSFSYDDAHRLLRTKATGAGVDPANAAATELVLESRAWDPAGRLTYVVDAMGRETGYAYFNDNLMASQSRVRRDPDGNILPTSLVLASYGYDPAAHLTSQTTAGAVTTTWTYDAAGSPATQSLDPSGLNRLQTLTRRADGLVTRVVFTGAASPGRSERVDYAYDAAGRLLTSTVDNTGGSPATVTTSWAYDPRGLVRQLTDPAGAVTDYGYDSAGRLSTMTSPARTTWVGGASTANVRPVTTYGWNTFGEQTQTRVDTGETWSAARDQAGRVTSRTLPTYTPPGGSAITAVEQLQYNVRGLPVKSIDALGRATDVGYDVYGRPTSITAVDPDGAGPKPRPVTTMTYDRNGEALEVVDATGGRRALTWDDLGRVATSSTSERVEGSTVWYPTTLGYNDAGNLTSMTSPLGHATSVLYNKAGEATRITDPTGTFGQVSYDQAGRVSSVATGKSSTYAGPATQFVYDLAGRAVSTRDCTPSTTTGVCGAGGTLRTTSTTYDAAGQPVTETSAAGRPTYRTYDAAGQLTSVTGRADPANAATAVTVSLGYDTLGRRTRMVDGRGNATLYTYTPWGLPESTIEPSTTAHSNATDRTWTTTYDAAGQAVGQALPGGVTRTRSYDGLGRLTGETGTGAAASTTARQLDYDAVGRPTLVSGPAGDSTYTYNDRGLLTGSTGPGGPYSFAYDSDARMTSRTDPTGTGTFTYDAADRLETAGSPLTGVAQTFGYDDLGRRQQVTTPGVGLTQAFTYDALGRLLTDVTTGSGGAVAASTSYGYDQDDLLTTKTTAGVAGAGANAYTYDGLSRLASWTRPDAQVISYGYDAASNRTTVTGAAGARTSTFDERNRLLTATGGGLSTDTFTWSARGTVTSRASGAQTANYTFDAFERLTEVQTPGYTVGYTYDSLDRMAQRNGVAASYADLTNNAVLNPSGSTERIFRDPFGTPLSTKVGSGPGSILLTDGVHNDVTAAIDPASGAVTGSASYDPYGQVTASGTLPLGFQGGWTDPQTGQVNAASRWYDSGTGAFDSRDTWTLAPSPTNSNRYAYGAGAPTVNTDPGGHDPGPAGPGGGSSQNDPCIVLMSTAATGCPDGSGGGGSGGGGGSDDDTWCLMSSDPVCQGYEECADVLLLSYSDPGDSGSCDVTEVNPTPGQGGKKGGKKGGGAGGSTGGGSTGGGGGGRVFVPQVPTTRPPVDVPNQRPASVELAGGPLNNPGSAPVEISITGCTTTCAPGSVELVADPQPMPTPGSGPPSTQDRCDSPSQPGCAPNPQPNPEPTAGADTEMPWLASLFLKLGNMLFSALEAIWTALVFLCRLLCDLLLGLLSMIGTAIIALLVAEFCGLGIGCALLSVALGAVLGFVICLIQNGGLDGNYCIRAAALAGAEAGGVATVVGKSLVKRLIDWWLKRRGGGGDGPNLPGGPSVKGPWDVWKK